MANPSVANVVAALPALTGGISAAPIGTALPTDSTTALNVAFKGLGFVGDGGLTANIAKTTNPVRDWGGKIIANLQTDVTETFSFTFVEALNADVVKEVYGAANVTVTAPTSTVGTLLAIKHNDLILPNREFSFDMFAGLGKRRIVVPTGQIVLNGDVSYTNGSVVSYPVTLTAYPDSQGNTSYEYTTDGVTT